MKLDYSSVELMKRGFFLLWGIIIGRMMPQWLDVKGEPITSITFISSMLVLYLMFRSDVKKGSAE